MSQAVQSLKYVLNRQLASSQKFSDEEFIPKPQAILGPTYSKYHLRRASDLYREVSIVPEEISPNDIEEGLLKDGYFLSAVAALAEEPSLIQRLFLTEESNKVGLYAIWLCDSGTWKPILLDEYIPCNERSGSYFPIFAQSTNDDLWISLLEKAYAKIYGSYVNIEGGSCQHALRDLTGAPVEELRDETDIDKIWDFISDSLSKEYFLCCSNDSTQTIQGQETQKEGSDNSYAYTVLDAREVETKRGLERLIMIRNTWKNFEWKGEWSNHSDLWTERLREELNYTEEDAQNGLFWIKLEDYEAYFPVTWVCKYKPNNKYFSVDLHHELKSHDVLRIRVHKEQEITISLNQKDALFFQGTNYEGQYNYSYARILLGKVFNEGLGYVSGNASERHRNLTITQRLKPGTYILTAELHWNQSFFRDFNVSFYCEHDIEIESVPEADLLTIQKSLVLSSIEKVEESRKVRTYAKYGDSLIEKTEGSIHGLLYFYYMNDTKKNTKLTEKLTFSNLEHMQICFPFNNPSHVEVTLVPDHEVLVLFKATREEHAWSFSTAFSMQPLQPNEPTLHVLQENYDYIDDPRRQAPLEINNDYNTYIKEGHDLDFEEGENGLVNRSTVEERKTAESVKKGGLNASYYSDKHSIVSQRAQQEGIERPSKKYPTLNMEVGQTNSKKIPYTNYDDYDKEIEVVSSDPKLVVIKDDRFKVNAGDSAFIRVRFVAPNKPGVFNVQVDVRNIHAGVEETLHFVINNIESEF